MRSPARGRRASACWSCVSEDPARRRPGALRQAAGGPAARAVDGALRGDDGAACSSSEERARPHRRYAAAGGGARRRGDHHSRRRTRHRGRRDRATPQANNVTQIVIGKSTRSRWFEMLHGSVVARARAAGPATSACTSLPARDRARVRSAGRPCRDGRDATPFDPRPYLCARCSRSPPRSASACSSTVARHRERRSRVPDRGASRIAVRYGLWPSLLRQRRQRRSCYNFFFLPPLYTFTITDPDNVVAFVLLHRGGGHRLAIVAARVRTQARGRAAARARRRRMLYAFSRKLAGVGTLDDLLWATAYQIALMLKVRVVLLLPEDGTIAVQGRLSAGGYARRGRCRGREMGMGERSRRPGAARTRCRARSGCSCRCAPAAAPIGVVGIDSDKPGPLLTPDQRRLLDALIDQARARDRARATGRGRGRARSARSKPTACARRC